MKKILALLISGLFLVVGAYAEAPKKDEKKPAPVAEKKAEDNKKAEDKKEEKKNIGPRNRQTKKEQEKGDTARLDANKK